MKRFLLSLQAAIALPTSVNAENIYRNQYYEPYGSPSYSVGSQNYNDATEQYGSPLRGPTLRVMMGTITNAIVTEFVKKPTSK